MENSIQKQSNEVVTEKLNEGGEKMNRNISKIKQNVKRLGPAHEQNIIELFTHIYFNPKRHTVYSLAHEISKSVRTVHRMLEEINNFCPCIKKSVNEIDGCARIYVSNEFTENYLDICYAKSQRSPMLYIFLTMFLVRPLAIKDIVKKISTNNKDAKKMVERIFDTTAYVDSMELDEEEVYGNWKFFE